MKDKRSKTLAEIHAKLAPGTDVNAFAKRAADVMRIVLAERLGWPVSRFSRCEFINMDEAMPGKVAVDIQFAPALSPEEQTAFRKAMNEIAAEAGSRPPIAMPQA